MRKTIKTETMYGLWRVKATVRKWLGINRVDGDYWGVTHLASRRKLPGYFVSKRDAIAASKIARSLFPHPLRKKNQHQMPTEREWFDQLKDNAIPFIR